MTFELLSNNEEGANGRYELTSYSSHGRMIYRNEETLLYLYPWYEQPFDDSDKADRTLEGTWMVTTESATIF